MARISAFISLLITMLLPLQHARAQTALLINELMVNPSNGELPPYEYIELFNNSQETIKLEEYSLVIGSNTITMPTYRLAPQQYILLHSESASAVFAPYGNTLPLNRWYALNNTGSTISLIKDDVIEDSVPYSDNWYNNTTKRRGGWSLERINPYISCNTAVNWAASVNPMGGTPCNANSILNTTDHPAIAVTSSTLTENKITLSFNTPLQDFIFLQDNFTLYPDGEKPVDIQFSIAQDSLYLYFGHNLTNNTLYTLQIAPLQWCSQELFIADIPLFRQGIIAYNDIIINEILFNPKDGGVDFVELFNRSSFPINLQDWSLGSRTISSEILFIQPQEHLALSTAPSALYQQYPTDPTQRIQQVVSLPAYPNQQGNVVLYAGNKTIDSLYYNASMHSPFLKNVKGISLERQSTEQPTNESGNFISASTIGGGATPGYKNSVQTKFFSKKNIFFLTSKTVSPNGDSYEDFLEINYELEEAHYMMNIDIYSDRGRLINRLIRQQNGGLSGKITWDCRTENGLLVNPGIYVYHIELYDNKGHRETKKGAFVVTHTDHGT